MRMNRRQCMRSLFAVTTGGAPALLLSSRADATVGDYSREWTQILNKIQLLQQYIRQGEELRQKVLMVLDMAKHTAQLPLQVFGPIMAEIGALHGVVRQGTALAYSMANLDVEFSNRFKGFGYRPDQFFNEYRTWSRSTLDTTLGTLKAAGLQANQMVAEEGVLTQLRTMSRSSDGRLKAVQIGLQLSEQAVQQMMKLRQLMLADIQSKQSFQAWQMQQGSNREAAAERFFTNVPPRNDARTYRGGNQ